MKTIVFLATFVSLLPLAAADVSIVDDHQDVTVDCATDPGVSILANSATVTLVGTCTRVSIAGNHNTVSGSAVTVSIAGNHNTAMLDAVDRLSILGNHNTATYKRTVAPGKHRPTVNAPGTGNTISPAK